MTIVNGFFDGADVTLENSILHIQLKNGGYQILMRYHVTEYLQQLLNRLFQLSLQVKIDGEDEVPADDFAAMIQAAEQNIARTPIPETVQPTAQVSPKQMDTPKAQTISLTMELPQVVPDSAVLIKDVPFEIYRFQSKKQYRNMVAVLWLWVMYLQWIDEKFEENEPLLLTKLQIELILFW